MKAEPIIINHPERQTSLQRLTFALITMVAWTFWVSLWLPLLTLIAWLLGFEDVYIKLGFSHPFQAVADLSLVVPLAMSAALSLGLWAFYNRMRFAGKQKRRGNRLLHITEMAPVLSTSIDAARQLRAGRRAVIHFADDGQIFLDDENDSD